MNSLVNYGSSDSEEEITDEEEVYSSSNKIENGKIEDFDIAKPSALKLPEPSNQRGISKNLIEEDDEFLQKKAVPSVAPPKKKEKVKITIPRMSDFKDDDDEKKMTKTIPANKKAGLLSMLPRPSNSFAPAPRPSARKPTENKTSSPQSTVSSAPTDLPKKVGFIPYSLMSHKPKTADTKKSTLKADSDNDEDDDEQVGSFFTFGSKDDEHSLPTVSDAEVRALVEKESARLEERKRQHEGTNIEEELQYQQSDSNQYLQQQNIDEEAMRALMGGNKAKRSKVDNIQIIDLSAAEVMPNRDEWLRKTLAGETSYVPTGHISEKVKVFNIFQLKQLLKLFIILGPECISETKTSNFLFVDAS